MILFNERKYTEEGGTPRWVAHIEWAELEFTDLMLLHAILSEANALRPLELFEPEYLQRLEGQVGEFGLPAAGKKVSVQSFCMVAD